MTQILNSRKDDLVVNKLTNTRQIIRLESHLSIGGSSRTYTAKTIRFPDQYYELQHLTELKLAEYLAAKTLAEKDEKQFYKNSVFSRVQAQSLVLGSSVEISNPLININFISLINNLLIKLGNKYAFSDPIEVLKYLNEKKYLILWLQQAYQKIREVFTDELLVLKVILDPEIVEWKRLIITIQTNKNADEAYEAIKILDNSWWLEATSEIGNDLDINIEFDEF